MCMESIRRPTLPRKTRHPSHPTSTTAHSCRLLRQVGPPVVQSVWKMRSLVLGTILPVSGAISSECSDRSEPRAQSRRAADACNQPPLPGSERAGPSRRPAGIHRRAAGPGWSAPASRAVKTGDSPDPRSAMNCVEGEHQAIDAAEKHSAALPAARNYI